jgi:hypothetical protein
MVLADRPTTSRWTPPSGGPSHQVRPIHRRQEPRPTLRAQEHSRRRPSHSEPDLGSAFDPTRTVARAGNQNSTPGSHSPRRSRGDGGCGTGPLARHRLASRRRAITFGRPSARRLRGRSRGESDRQRLRRGACSGDRVESIRLGSGDVALVPLGARNAARESGYAGRSKRAWLGAYIPA